jgi:hypothetical protein
VKNGHILWDVQKTQKMCRKKAYFSTPSDCAESATSNMGEGVPNFVIFT